MGRVPARHERARLDQPEHAGSIRVPIDLAIALRVFRDRVRGVVHRCATFIGLAAFAMTFAYLRVKLTSIRRVA